MDRPSFATKYHPARELSNPELADAFEAKLAHHTWSFQASTFLDLRAAMHAEHDLYTKATFLGLLAVRRYADTMHAAFLKTQSKFLLSEAAKDPMAFKKRPVTPELLTDYENRCAQMDWLYEFTDDHALWTKCQQEGNELRAIAIIQGGPFKEIYERYTKG